MRCPSCQHDVMSVLDSRWIEGGFGVRRRRECDACHERITTYERTDAPQIEAVPMSEREMLKALLARMSALEDRFAALETLLASRA